MTVSAQALAIAETYLANRQPVGQTSKLADHDKLTKFLDALRDGCYVSAAADYSGLGQRTVYDWMKRAETETGPESPYAQFTQAVKEAEAAAEAAIVKRVRAAADLPQFWAAGMTLLERRHPERWSKRQDDSQAPKIVVQIGTGVGDVKVGIALSPSTFASDSPKEYTPNSLTGNAFALPSSPITAVMVTNDQTVSEDASHAGPTQIPAVESTGGPLPGGPVAGGQRTPATRKRSSVRGPRNKKKGHG